MGGKLILEKYGKEHFKKLSEKGQAARRLKKLLQKDIVDPIAKQSRP